MGKFQVYEVMASGAGVAITGRLLEGIIARGNRVCCAYCADTTGAILGEPIRLGLLIEEIVAYGRSIDEIEEGLTALLRLRGDWATQVSQGWIVEIR